MCRAHSWSRYDVDLWPQGQIYRFLMTCFRVLPITFFPLTFLPYLAHGCFIMRICVAHTHDPDKTLTFDLKVKFKGFLTCFRVWPITIFLIDIGLPYLYITMRGCVLYIYNPDMTLTFDLKVKSRVYDMALCSGHSHTVHIVLWLSHTMFGTWVYHHGMKCHVHSWPLYDLDLWPQHQN